MRVKPRDQPTQQGPQGKGVNEGLGVGLQRRVPIGHRLGDTASGKNLVKLLQVRRNQGGTSVAAPVDGLGVDQHRDAPTERAFEIIEEMKDIDPVDLDDLKDDD